MISKNTYNNLLFDKIPLLLISIGFDGTIVDSNQNIKDLTGDSHMSQQKNFFDYIPTEEIADVAKQIEIANKTTKYNFRSSIISKSGHIHIIEWNTILYNQIIKMIGYDITNIYNNKDLFDKNLFYSTIFDTANIGHWRYNVKTKKIDASTLTFSWFNIDPNLKPSLAQILENVTFKSKRDIANSIMTAIRDVKPFSIDITIKNKEKPRYINLAGNVISDENKTPAYLYGIIQNITDRKEIENELENKNESLVFLNKELSELNQKLSSANNNPYTLKNSVKGSECNYRDIFNTTADAIIIHDALSLAIVDINQTALTLYGFSDKQEALLSDFTVFYGNNEWLKSMKSAHEHEYNTTTEYQNYYEWQVCKKTGEKLWIDIYFVKTIINNSLRILAIVRDIADRKNTLKLLSQLLENMEEVAWSYDLKENRFIYISPSCKKIFGYSENEFKNNPILWKRNIHPMDVEFVVNEIKKNLTKDDFTIEYRIINSSGKTKWIKARCKTTHDEKRIPIKIDSLIVDITKQKEVEFQLSSVKRKYSELTKLSIDGIAIGSPEGLILEANDQFLNLIGRTKKETLNKHISLFFNNEDNINKPFRFDLLHKGQIIISERAIIRPDSIKITVETHAKKMPEGTLQLVAHDITDRKKKEEEIKYLSNLHKLITTLSVRFINLKPELLKDEINLSLQELGEFSGVDRAYLFSYDFVKDTQTNTFEWCADGVSSEKDNLIDIPNALLPELILFHKQGKVGYISDVSLLNDDSALKKILIDSSVKSLITIPLYIDNTCFGFVGFDSLKKHRQWNDEEISTLKLFADLLVNVQIKEKYDNSIVRAKSEAEQNEKKIRNLIEHSPIGILNVLPNGTILELNEAVIKILGSPSIEHTKKLNILTTKTLIESGFTTYFLQCVRQKEVIKDELRYISVWGKESHLRFYLTPIFMDDTVQSVYINIEDISEMHQTKLRLVQLKEKAEESDRLKSAFLANMSHEIRTPMNGIIGFAELLKDPYITDEKKKYFVDIINTNAYHLLDLINDIIDISKIESGQINYNPNEVNLNSLLRKIENMWLPIAKNKNIKLVNIPTLDNNQCGIITDALKLKQIIINLISNAFKFTNNGKVEFGYTLNNNELLFYVSDTGKGIPPESVNKIFERFYQLDNLPNDSRTGTGLGLSICYAYVQLLGGKIWLNSELNKGTTFYFTIPYNSTTIISETTMENYDNYNWSEKTILLAEDDIPNSVYIVESLRKTKVNIIAVKTGYDAIEEIKSGKHFDLILMDIKMPIIGGLTATKEILKINPQIPIIAQTAYAFVEDIEKAKNAGCVDFISKPMKSAELISTIAKYLH